MARSGDVNVFLEISHLSGLVMNSDKHQRICSAYNINANYKETELDSNISLNCERRTSVQDKSVEKQNERLLLPTVSDRSETGSITTHYSFTAGTRQVFQTLQKLKIPFETEIYKPKVDRLFIDKNIFYCKNLFLKDRKGQFYLAICHEDFNIDLKLLRKSLNANRNFNFGTADDMYTILGTKPGGVTPLALTNPNSADVKMVIHKSLVKEDSWLMFHPLDSKLATKITLASLLRYLKSCNHSVIFVK